MRISHCKLTVSAFLGLVQWVYCDKVEFKLDLTWEKHEVAGITKNTILTNGQFPGPTLRMNQGDDVSIVVNNTMPFATSIHWHGIQQQGTPWSDGVPGLTQKSIKSGEQFTYSWRADDYGAYLYHSHHSAQLDDGLYGAIYVDPKPSLERPFTKISLDPEQIQALRRAERNTHPIILSDWRTFTSDEIIKIEEDSGVENYCASSILLNGKGSVICPSQEHINDLTRSELKQVLNGRNMTDMGCMPPTPSRLGFFPFNATNIPTGYYQGCKPTQGEKEVLHVNPIWKWVSYDVSSMAGSSEFVFSIDEHPMYIYAVDGRYVEPTLVSALTVHIGTRYSIMVKLDKPAGNYTIRAANSYTNQIINGTAILNYDPPFEQFRPSKPYITEIGTSVTSNTTFLTESNLIPFPSVKPSQDVSQTHILNLHLHNSSYMWELSNTTYPMSIQELPVPALFNRSAIPPENTISTLNGTWVDLIVNVTGGQPQHPLHKHSNKFFVIGSGTSEWKYASVAEAVEDIPGNFNLVNPQYRDTYPTPTSRGGPSWLALRYFVQNPGPFFFHCHVMMHEYGGLGVALLDGVDAWPVVPLEYQL
ncbi:hypothetical protein BO70DRAFT_418339 [Aspergillus heteromorphus CBS 117.55]|uniref:L-ascorbate oxidase n=1 Tax=Aspergillus heteromorphus CBS 117.55 TaxID=1448321 RepID=A0A317WS76_9EURO|nr:uncharacterized protein BO70DRAFT_418339 [Aspergillus heteromorphus CBS 117.55]PWY89219.1 hypothetical protein BO70DRAFT_418339 [Aspergillus heteromorphus CBS 117.55]